MTVAAPESRINRCDTLAIALFLCAIWAPLIDLVVGIDRTRLSAARQEEVRFPEVRMRWSVLKALPGKLKWYLQNHSGFRAALIRWHGILKVEYLGVSANPEVLLGKDGWLFLNGKHVTQDHRGLAPFTADELESWRNILESRQEWLERRGIAYIFVIAPNKGTIYPEFLPDGMDGTGDDSRLNQLVSYLRSRSRCHVVDVRPALRRAKAYVRVYHRTDSHWNEVGGVIASQEILRHLKARFPRLQVPEWSESRTSVTVAWGGDLARLMGLKYDIGEERIEVLRREPRGPEPSFDAADVRYRGVVVTECTRGQIPRAVVLRDSFGEVLIPPLSECFGRAVFVWSDSTAQGGFEPEAIERERPNVVIQQLVERRLVSIRPKSLVAIGTRPSPSETAARREGESRTQSERTQAPQAGAEGGRTARGSAEPQRSARPGASKPVVPMGGGMIPVKGT